MHASLDPFRAYRLPSCQPGLSVPIRSVCGRDHSTSRLAPSHRTTRTPRSRDCLYVWMGAGAGPLGPCCPPRTGKTAEVRPLNPRSGRVQPKPTVRVAWKGFSWGSNDTTLHFGSKLSTALPTRRAVLRRFVVLLIWHSLSCRAGGALNTYLLGVMGLRIGRPQFRFEYRRRGVHMHDSHGVEHACQTSMDVRYLLPPRDTAA